MSDNEYNASSDPVTEEMEAVWRYTEIGRMVNQDGQPDLASCTRCLRDQVHCQPSGGTESCTNCINTGHTNSCNVNGLIPRFDGDDPVTCAIRYVGKLRQAGLGVWPSEEDPVEESAGRSATALRNDIQDLQEDVHLPDLDHAGQDDIPVAELVTVVQWATYRRQHARPFSFFFPELRLDMEWVDGLRGGGGGGGGGEEAAGERTEGEGEEDLDPPPQETSPMSASNANTTPEGD